MSCTVCRWRICGPRPHRALPGGQETVHALRQQHPVGQVAAARIVLLVVVVDAYNVVEAGAKDDIFVRHDVDTLDALATARAGQWRDHVELGTLKAGDAPTEEGGEFVDVGALVLGNPGHGQTVTGVDSCR